LAASGSLASLYTVRQSQVGGSPSGSPPACS
jgi:hypothetical protein